MLLKLQCHEKKNVIRFFKEVALVESMLCKDCTVQSSGSQKKNLVIDTS